MEEQTNLSVGSQDKRTRRKVVYCLSVFLVLLVLLVIVVLGILLIGPLLVGNVSSNIITPGYVFYLDTRAWLDENEDGVWDSNEGPLQGVKFSIVVLTRYDVRKSSDVESNWRGNARYRSDVYQFPPVDVEISAEAPPGYRFTTPNHINVSSRISSRGCVGCVFYFGLIYLPGMPTVTPFPPAPICTLFAPALRVKAVHDIAVAPDGTFWFLTGDGSFHFDPTENSWMHYNYPERDRLVGDWARAGSVAVSSDGVVWFGTREGVTRFDGNSWASYTTEDGLASNYVVDVVVAPDGTVWATTSESYPVKSEKGISRFSPDTDSWITDIFRKGFRISDMVVDEDGIWGVAASGQYVAASRQYLDYFDFETEGWEYISCDDYTALALAPDGSLWLGAMEQGIRRFMPGEDDRSAGFWTYYFHPSDDIIVSERIHTMVFALDGSLWVGTNQGVIRCVVQGTPTEEPTATPTEERTATPTTTANDDRDILDLTTLTRLEDATPFMLEPNAVIYQASGSLTFALEFHKTQLIEAGWEEDTNQLSYVQETNSLIYFIRDGVSLSLSVLKVDDETVLVRMNVIGGFDLSSLPRFDEADIEASVPNSLVYQTPAAVEEVVSFIREELTALGWQETETIVNSSGQYWLSFTKDDLEVSVSIGKGARTNNTVVSYNIPKF